MSAAMRRGGGLCALQLLVAAGCSGSTDAEDQAGGVNGAGVASDGAGSEGAGSDGGGSAAGPSPHEGDPCRSLVFQREGESSAVYAAVDRPGDIPWIATEAIIHTKDYFAYSPFVSAAAPTNWLTPNNLTEGQLWLHVEVLEMPPGAELPIYYTVTWQQGRQTDLPGFLRAAVAIDKSGPATYDAVADIRSLEYSPDGSCCQSVCGKPWPWDRAWTSVAGDVVVLKGNGFPLKVKTRIVLRPPR